MKRRRPTAEQQRAEERYFDRRGIAYEDRRLLVTARVDTWPPYMARVKKDTEKLQAAFHRELASSPCWLCGTEVYDYVTGRTIAGKKKELHHLAAGSRGRSHERELFTLLCHDCHENVTYGDLPKLLWAKWKFDHAYCDWELLLIRHGHHFGFELEIPDWCKPIYRNG